MKHLFTTLQTVRLGEPFVFENGQFFPLFRSNKAVVNYLTMNEAIQKKLLTIREINQGGSVNNLNAENLGDLPILILDGEEVHGAKQNRVMNTTLLLAPHTKINIPVSCTEQGRWSSSFNLRDSMTDANFLLDAHIRERKARAIKENLKSRKSFSSEQSEVWSDVANLHRSLGFQSPTGAYDEVHKHLHGNSQELLQKFPYQEGQCGVLFFLGGTFIAIDFVSQPGAYQIIHQKLLRGYFVQMQRMRNIAPTPITVDQAQQTLQSFETELMTGKGHDLVVSPSVSLGTDVRITTEEKTAIFLVYQDELIHGAIFRRNVIQGSSQEPEEMEKIQRIVQDIRNSEIEMYELTERTKHMRRVLENMMSHKDFQEWQYIRQDLMFAIEDTLHLLRRKEHQLHELLERIHRLDLR